MIRKVFIFCLGGAACLFLAVSIAAFTYGSTSTVRSIYESPLRINGWETNVFFVHQRFRVSRSRNYVSWDEAHASFEPLNFTSTKWGSERLPTFVLTGIKHDAGKQFSGVLYMFDSTAESLLAIGCILGAYPAISFVRGPLSRRSRRRRGLCLKCGYNLAGNTSGVCPECGTPRTGTYGETGI
jgi:hypothetical protein